MSDLGPDDVEILQRDWLARSFFKLERLSLRHKRFAGDWLGPIRRELMHRGPAVAVLPYDPWQDQLVLLQQFRVGALERPQGPWLYEIVAGMIEPGETPEAVAMRETREESGCQLLSLQPISAFYTSPGGCNEFVHLYCGLVDSRQLTPSAGLADEHEDIRVFSLPVAQAFDWLAEGRFDNSPIIIGLMWLQGRWPSLRQQCLAQWPDGPPA